MPALGPRDPADLEAWTRAELGFSRQLEQPWQVAPHPSLGGSSGYPIWHREEQLERWNAGEVTDISKRSLFRWSRRLKPYHQTGNRERSQIIRTKLLNLITYIIAWLDATLDKMARWQSVGGSAAATWRWQAARRQRWERKGGGGSTLVVVIAATAAQQRRAVGRQAEAERWWWWQHGGSTAAALAVRWRRQQHGGSVGRSSTAAVRRKRAAWRRHLQHGVSGGSMVAALAEQQRQRGSSATMAGSMAEASPEQGWQRCPAAMVTAMAAAQRR
jgi:hypothetical protein